MRVKAEDAEFKRYEHQHAPQTRAETSGGAGINEQAHVAGVG